MESHYNAIIVIAIPSRRISLYVIYGSVIIIIIANDMFVIIALPDGFAAIR